MNRIKQLFKDRHDRVVVWQAPNLLLGCWIVLRILMFIVSQGKLHLVFEQLSNAVLFTWAYLEITEGVTTFRKVLGGAVMTLLVLGISLHP